MFLHHGCEKCEGERLGPSVGGVHFDREHRVPLVRHGRRSTPSRHRGLGQFGDLGLSQQDDVARDLGRGATRDGQRAGDRGDAGTAGVPRHDRLAQSQRFRQGAHDVHTGPGEGRQCPHGAAELDGQPPVSNVEDLAASGHRRGEPARRFEPEGDRRRRLHQRAAQHQGVAVRLGQSGGCRFDTMEVGRDEIETPSHDQHGGGVEDVLAGRAPVDPAGNFRRKRGPHFRDERYDRVGRLDRGLPNCRDVVTVDVGHGSHRVGHAGRDQPFLFLDRCQRQFDVEHGLHPRAVAGDRRHRRRGEHGVKQQ